MSNLKDFQTRVGMPPDSTPMVEPMDDEVALYSLMSEMLQNPMESHGTHPIPESPQWHQSTVSPAPGMGEGTMGMMGGDGPDTEPDYDDDDMRSAMEEQMRQYGDDTEQYQMNASRKMV